MSTFHQSPVAAALSANQDLIQRLYVEQDQTINQVLSFLTDMGIKCSRRSLMSKLGEWNFKKHTRSQDTPSMRVEIAYLFWIKCLSDKKILRVCIAISTV
jgi:hypothetical protein